MAREAAVRALAETRPWLTVHGAAPWADVIAAQAAADVCLSAALMENVGVAILEALALGTPVVTTAVGDAPRYLPPALGWLATPAGRPDLLAVALGRVRDDLGDVRARSGRTPRAARTPRPGADPCRAGGPLVALTRCGRRPVRSASSGVAAATTDDAAVGRAVQSRAEDEIEVVPVDWVRDSMKLSPSDRLTPSSVVTAPMNPARCTRATSRAVT